MKVQVVFTPESQEVYLHISERDGMTPRSLVFSESEYSELVSAIGMPEEKKD